MISLDFTDVEHIRYELITFLIASRDTVSAQIFPTCPLLIDHQTSSLLTFVIYLLSTNPDTCRRLREEIIETFGLSGTPSYGHLKKMEYRACVSAALFLHLAE